MLNEPSIETSGTTAAALELVRRDSLCPSERADAVSYDWARIGIGIVLAGGAYPLVLASIFVIVGTLGYALSVLTNDQNVPGSLDVVRIVIAIMVYSGMAAFAGVLWSGLIAAMTLPFVYLFVWSLQLRTSIVRIGAFAGGLVGFICVLPVALSRPWLGTSGKIWEMFLILLLGPMLTTVLGQLGGAWGGSKSRESANLGMQIVALPSTSGLASNNRSELPDNVSPRVQFGIRHLLWISVWLSLLLALIRFCGIRYEYILPLLMGWFVFQFSVLWLGGLLLPRVIRWRARQRQFRST